MIRTQGRAGTNTRHAAVFVFQGAVAVPIPLLIPIAVMAVPVVATAVIAAVKAISTNLPKKLHGKNVAILGAQRVGKTTLLRYLETGNLPTLPSVPTVDADLGGRFDLDIGGAAVTFDVPRDLPGNQGLGFPDWREAAEGADYVWYLFRADLVARDDVEATKLLRTHLGLLDIWLSSLTNKVPKVVLIATHVDHPPGVKEFEEIAERVASVDVIKLATTQLKAKLVTGSLSADDYAEKLRDRLTRSL